MRRSSHWIGAAIRGEHTGPEAQVEGAVVTDSRDAQPGSLYVARRGENADGHDFLAAAAAAGAVAAIVEEVRGDGPATQIVVPDATQALGDLARAHLADLRSSGDVTVLAVTGSAGKTTTKDLLCQLLSTLGPTVAPKLSFNNEVGLPLTVLKADSQTRYLVLEMGASGPGHIDYLTAIAPPDIAIELMVGHAHFGGFGSVEATADAKAELVRGLVVDGCAILNIDDPRVSAMAKWAPDLVLTFSAAGQEAIVRAVDVTVDPDGRPSFILEIEGEKHVVHLTLVGLHHVSNALAAAAGAHAVGMSADRIAQGLSAATAQSPHRMAVSDVVIDGKKARIIDDAYNANLDSMKAGIAALAELGADRPTVAVFGDMLELGPETETMHRQVAQIARTAGIGRVITVGECSQVMGDELGSDTRHRHAETPQDAVKMVCEDLEDGSVVLIKGSQGSGVFRVADALNERGAAK